MIYKNRLFDAVLLIIYKDRNDIFLIWLQIFVQIGDSGS